MNKIITLFLAFVFSASLALAQGSFQGTLKYEFKIMGEGVEQYQAMLPTGMSMTVRKSDMVIEMQGGMMAAMIGKILVKGKKGKSYMIKDSEETIYVIDPKKMKEEGGDAETPDPTITKEDETIKIAGYQCQKYKVETMSAMGPVTQYVWVTEEIKMPEMKGGASVGGGGGMGSSLNIKGLPGMPHKSMSTQGPMTVILTAAEVDKSVPEKGLFKLPKGYDKQDFDLGAMMGGGGMGM